MKAYYYIMIIVLTFYFFSNCKKNDDLLTDCDIEKIVKEKHDNRAVFYYSQYQQILEKLKSNKFEVLPMYKFYKYYDDDKILVSMRHDVDCHIFKAYEMANMENKMDISTSYFILHTAEYYGSFIKDTLFKNDCIDDIYQKIHNLNHEIGIHNDLLTILIQYKINPLLFTKSEISNYSKLNIPIYGTASHGSTIARETVTNYEIFSDFNKKDTIEYKGTKYQIGQNSLKDYGFEYEAYFTNYNIYISDAGGEWNIGFLSQEGNIWYKSTFDDVLNTLENAQPGDRIVILTHPVWWGKK